MSSIPISLLDLENDASVSMEAEDYQKREGKWCAGCGDFGALNSVKRLLAKHQLQAAETVFIDDMRINLTAAAALGIQTVQFADADQCREALVHLGCLSSSHP